MDVIDNVKNRAKVLDHETAHLESAHRLSRRCPGGLGVLSPFLNGLDLTVF